MDSIDERTYMRVPEPFTMATMQVYREKGKVMVSVRLEGFVEEGMRSITRVVKRVHSPLRSFAYADQYAEFLMEMRPTIHPDVAYAAGEVLHRYARTKKGQEVMGTKVAKSY